MNPRLFFGLAFGIPTVFLAYVYYDLGINNLWQLFVFIWAAALGYMPGIIVYTYYIRDRMRKRDKIQKSLVDFVDSRVHIDK